MENQPDRFWTEIVFRHTNKVRPYVIIQQEINRLIIVDGKGKTRFEMGKRMEEPVEPIKAPEPPAPKPKVIKVNRATKLLTNAGYVSLKTIDKEKLQKMYDSGYYAEANTEIEKVLGVLSKSDQEVLDNI